MQGYNKITNVTDSERNKFKSIAEQVVDDQYTDVVNHEPFTGEDRDIFVAEVTENMAYGYRFGRDEYLLLGGLIGAGLTALGITLYNKFKNRKKNKEESL